MKIKIALMLALMDFSGCASPRFLGTDCKDMDGNPLAAHCTVLDPVKM